MEVQQKYICICGKTFDNSQKFNGHKSQCKIHQLHKYGSLEPYYLRQQQNQPKRINSFKNTKKLQREQKYFDKQKELDNWLVEKHRCKTCGKIMTEYYGSGIYCSIKCSHNRTLSEETKKKISKSNTKTGEQRYCLLCNKIIRKNNKTGYCKNCLLHASELKEYRSNLAKHRYSFIKNHKYWMPRNQISYAEQFWIKVLENNNIFYEHDKVVIINNKHHYFLDFYIKRHGKLVDLEIDGKQHKYKDREESDKQRDYFLKNEGYLVYRISWNEIRSEEGKQSMKSKIDKFLDFYNKL